MGFKKEKRHYNAGKDYLLMKKVKIKVFVSLLSSNFQEWLSLEGDKFSFSQPFASELSSDLKSSDLIVLDALYSKETAMLIEKELSSIDPLKCMIVVLNYCSTLFEISSLRRLDLSKFLVFELDSSQFLPEDFLNVLHQCYEKFKNANPK